jgi:hypothetical protein
MARSGCVPQCRPERRTLGQALAGKHCHGVEHPSPPGDDRPDAKQLFRLGREPACTGRAQAHQLARHPDVRSLRLQIEPASPSVRSRRRPGVELKSGLSHDINSLASARRRNP